MTASELSRAHWSALPRSPLGPRSDPILAWTGHELFELGGTKNGVVQRDGATLDPASQHWRSIAQVPGSIGLNGAVSVSTGPVGRQLFVASGKVAGLYDPVTNSRGLSLARATCHSSAVYGADPLRSLPKPQQRRIHLAVILGRPVPPPLAGAAAGHASRLRWISVAGGIIAVIGAAMLVATAFAPHATWSLWLTPATFLVWGAIFLLFGSNARRAARLYHHPRG